MIWEHQCHKVSVYPTLQVLLIPIRFFDSEYRSLPLRGTKWGSNLKKTRSLR